ncbi:MAG: ATP-binding protein [Candidatus Binatia bacterium]
MRSSWIPRRDLEESVRAALRRAPVVTLLGPRQCGKTTLANHLARGITSHYFDLEDPATEGRLAQPMTALGPLRGLIIVDEVQRAPALFPVLRVLADRSRTPARFLLLGSASPDLVRASSESLAGRVSFVDMGGFGLREVGEERLRSLWLRGGFPRSFLAKSDSASAAWRRDFIRTFLERDIRAFGVSMPTRSLRRLWVMLAHYHGQVWNASEIGRSLGEAHTTVRRHADVLVGALVVRELQPWFENVGKREIKSTKLYVRDSGLLHALLGVGSFAALESHPKLGASWEGFVIEQLLATTGERDAYCWGTQSGAELDLLLTVGGKRIGVEVNYADAPRATRSMRVAMEDLGLSRLYVVHPGTARYGLGGAAEAIGLAELLSELRGRGGRAPRQRRRRVSGT